MWDFFILLKYVALFFQPMFLEPSSDRFIKQFETSPCHEDANDIGTDVDEERLVGGNVGMQRLPSSLYAINDRILHDVERVGDVAKPFANLGTLARYVTATA